MNWRDYGGCPTLRLGPLLEPGMGLCGCNTGQTPFMAFPCVPSHYGLRGFKGKSRWTLGGGASLKQAEGISKPQSVNFPGPLALDWSPMPLPALGLAPLAGGGPELISCPMKPALLPDQHLSESEREKGGGGSGS